MSRKSRAKPPSPFKRFNSSPEVIRLVVLMYVRFPLSLRNFEDLLFERGIDICHETVRFWWSRFGPMFAADIRRQRVSRIKGSTHWRWHLDEVFVKINGVAISNEDVINVTANRLPPHNFLCSFGACFDEVLGYDREDDEDDAELPDRRPRGDACDGMNGSQLRRCTRDNPTNYREQCAALAGPDGGLVMGVFASGSGAILALLAASGPVSAAPGVGVLTISGLESIRWRKLRCLERLNL